MPVASAWLPPNSEVASAVPCIHSSHQLRNRVQNIVSYAKRRAHKHRSFAPIDSLHSSLEKSAKLDADGRTARGAWADEAWKQLGHSHHRQLRQLPAPERLTQDLTSAILVETGKWSAEQMYAYNWNLKGPRQKFPNLQGAGGYIYFGDQVFTTAWMLGEGVGE